VSGSGHALRCGPETFVTSPLRCSELQPICLLLQLFRNIDPFVETVGMWKSRGISKRKGKGWEAGSMAFHPFHSSSFAPWSPFPKTGLGGKCPDSPLPSRLSRTWMDSNGSMSHSPCLRRGELTLKKIHACKGRDQTFLIGNRAFPLLTSDRASDRFLFARQPNLRFPSYSLWAQSGPFT
jgi:hypothetical protein